MVPEDEKLEFFFVSGRTERGGRRAEEEGTNEVDEGSESHDDEGTGTCDWSIRTDGY